jgi:hypothetical protein
MRDVIIKKVIDTPLYIETVYQIAAQQSTENIVLLSKERGPWAE